jgi:spore coat protein JC
MWEYKKILEYPVKITKPNPRFASQMLTAIGGPGGELAAAIRYFIQAPTMPDLIGQNTLVEIATEELGHVEILCAMYRQLTKDATVDEFINGDANNIFTDHGYAIYPTDASGNPFTVTYLASTGDPITDLTEDMAAEEKARSGYENLMKQTNDPEILAPLSFLRQREIIHYQRFAEVLKHYQQLKKD